MKRPLAMKPPKPSTLRTLRARHGLTQTACARLLHVSVRQWQRYESGRSIMPLAFWELLLLKVWR